MIVTWVEATAVCARTSRAAACTVVVEPSSTTSRCPHGARDAEPAMPPHLPSCDEAGLDGEQDDPPGHHDTVHVQQGRQRRAAEEGTEVVGPRERPADQRHEQDAGAEIETPLETAGRTASRGRKRGGAFIITSRAVHHAGGRDSSAAGTATGAGAVMNVCGLLTKVAERRRESDSAAPPSPD